MRTKNRTASGQGMAEYAAVIAACAIVIAVVAHVMREGFASDVGNEFSNCAQAQGNMAHLAATPR